MPRKLFEKVNEMEHEVFYGRKCRSVGIFQVKMNFQNLFLIVSFSLNSVFLKLKYIENTEQI